jgi:hypothetical protein
MDDERNDLATQTPPETTRRRLLRAATGGFALAACGLLLPAGPGETDAREGALGGAMGGRHGKDRRGRHRRRTHGDQKGQKDDKNKGKDDRPPGAGAPGGSPIRYVAIRAEGDAQTNVRFYFRTIDGLGRFSRLKLGDFGQFSDHRSNLDYAPKMYSTAVFYYSDRLPYSVLIEARNPLFSILPWAEVTWGCDIDGQGNVVGGSTYHRDGFSEISMDGYTPIHFETGLGNPKGNSTIHVLRYDDSDTHKWIGARVWRM